MSSIIKWILLGILAILAAVGIWALYVMWPMIYLLVFSGGIH